MTPRQLYEYAIKKGLADVEIALKRKNDTFAPLNKESVGVMEFKFGRRIVIKEA